MSNPTSARMRAHFQKIIDRAGIWVVYTRSDHRFRCRDCFDIDTRDAPANCGSCFGTGFETTLERWKVFFSNTLFRAAIANEPLTLGGWSAEHNPVVMTRHTEAPVLGDRFFLVEWNYPTDQIAVRGAQPVRISEALRVVFNEPMVVGQVCYYTAHCEYVSEARAHYSQVLLDTPIAVSRG